MGKQIFDASLGNLPRGVPGWLRCAIQFLLYNGEIMKSKALFCCLLLLLLLITNCVYYNTFYLAEKFYDEGIEEKQKAKETQRRGPSGNQKFDMTIEKCTRVLVRFPGSDYVDDALLLMGKAFYQKAFI